MVALCEESNQSLILLQAIERIIFLSRLKHELLFKCLIPTIIHHGCLAGIEMEKKTSFTTVTGN